MLKESLVYEKLTNQSVRCGICQRRCKIRNGEWGFCKTRINRDGKLFSSIYGEVSTWRRAPIEIKPVYHYMPGSHAFSMGSLGCNFLCPGCQNWDISFAKEEKLSTSTETISPGKMIEMAQRHNCQGISWTYNEPTLWLEYTLDGAKLAKKAGFYTNYVTNGYITPEALAKIGPYLDIFRVDIKAFDSRAYQQIANITKWEGILEVIHQAKKKWHMHVEVVTNMIPGISDDEDQMKNLAQWIKGELGNDTPWHITRFFPQWHLGGHHPTAIKKMKDIREMAIKQGLHYVYLGNIFDNTSNHTYCPGCGKIVIERLHYEDIKSHLVSGQCPQCSTIIPGTF